MKYTAKEYALFLIKLRDRSEREMRTKMQDKKFPPEEIDTVLAWLAEKNFVNDERYADMVLRSASIYQLKGKRAIVAKLYEKGISREIIENLEFEPEDQKAIALEAANKWLRAKGDRADRERLMRHLIAKGFDYETIKGVVDNLNIM